MYKPHNFIKFSLQNSEKIHQKSIIHQAHKMKKSKKLFYVICDNIRSLENIGSIFRTADALGVDKIFLCGISGRPPHPKIAKTALGAEKIIPFEHYWQTGRAIEKLKKSACAGRQKFQIVALEQAKNAVIYTKFKPKFPLVLILGNEVKGISKKILKKSDKIIYLPMQGKKESLNVSVAFGVAGYEINKYRK